MADIVYTYRGKVYLNITNRCPCRCTFCIRSNGDGLGSAHTLWHKSDPTAEEIAKAIEEFDFSDFPEVTFCGYGEPTERQDDIVWVMRELKKAHPTLKIRINTNGQADLINKRDTTPELEGLVDTLSISLNCASAKSYQAVCHSEFGEEAFDALIDYARRAKKYVPKVVFSIVRGSIPDSDIPVCQKIADDAGVTLRIREML